MTKGSPVAGSPHSADREGAGRKDQDPAGPQGATPRPAKGSSRWLTGAGSARRPAKAGNDQPARAGGPASAGSGYTYLSYMLGGMILYGFIGWLIGRWTHQAYLLPVGMIAGLALSIALIIYRVTRSGPGT